MRRLAFAIIALFLLGADAFAQAGAGPATAAQLPALDLNGLIPAGEGAFTGRVVQLVVLLTVLSVAPGLLIMVTSFTRFIVALSFLRAGLGLQSTPANLILISLALFMTFFVMQPTFERAYETGLQPLLANQIDETEAYARITEPFRQFMLAHVREKDIDLFRDLAAQAASAAPDAPAATAPQSAPDAAPGQTPTPSAQPVELRILVPAFMISELRRGFEIGFLIVLPFLVIDLIVSTLTMSMGMMMLPPTVISLPFKILFFVLIDGWNMLIGGLVRSYF
jgi:flagellar biosynthetic protein FliP